MPCWLTLGIHWGQELMQVKIQNYLRRESPIKILLHSSMSLIISTRRVFLNMHLSLKRLKMISMMKQGHLGIFLCMDYFSYNLHKKLWKFTWLIDLWFTTRNSWKVLSIMLKSIISCSKINKNSILLLFSIKSLVLWQSSNFLKLQMNYPNIMYVLITKTY